MNIVHMQPLAIYIHWPYCLKKCPYCDFNSHVADRVYHDKWRDAYAREIEYYAGILGKDRLITSIFFGGGTPSLMQPETVAHVIKRVREFWPVSNDCEITLEANPTSIESGKFKEFYNAGVNRVSVGVQSLRDDELRFLGREHSANEALKALQVANDIFNRVSFDLIYARPNQTMDDWQAELREAIALAKGHMSLYQLTIEDGTQFKTLRDSGRLVELDYDVAGDMYLMTQDIMNNAGMPAYEISNYASSGQESRHNLIYWNYKDYIGIGPGAHGRLTLSNGDKIATRTHKAPDIWMDKVLAQGHGANPFEALDNQTQKEEAIMMGLRLRDGIGADLLRGADLKMLFDGGFLMQKDNRIFVPQDKWPVLDSILGKILTCF